MNRRATLRQTRALLSALSCGRGMDARAVAMKLNDSILSANPMTSSRILALPALAVLLMAQGAVAQPGVAAPGSMGCVAEGRRAGRRSIRSPACCHVCPHNWSRRSERGLCVRGDRPGFLAARGGAGRTPQRTIAQCCRGPLACDRARRPSPRAMDPRAGIHRGRGDDALIVLPPVPRSRQVHVVHSGATHPRSTGGVRADESLPQLQGRLRGRVHLL